MTVDPRAQGVLVGLWHAVLTGALGPDEATREAGRVDHVPAFEVEAAAAAATIRTLDPAHPDTHRLADLCVAAGAACIAARRPLVAEALLEAALGVAPTPDRADAILRGRVEHVSALAQLRRYDDVLRKTDTLIEALRRCPNRVYLARCLANRGDALGAAGRPGGLEALGEAVVVLEQADPTNRLVGLCYASRSRILLAQGDAPAALREAARAVAAHDRPGLEIELAYSLYHRVRATSGDSWSLPADHPDAAAASSALTRAIGLLGRTAEHDALLGELMARSGLQRFALGQLENGLTDLDAAVEVYTRAGDRATAGGLCCCQGEALGAASRFAEAASRFARGADLLTGTSDARRLADCLRDLGRANERAEDYNAALAAYTRAESLVPSLPSAPDALLEEAERLFASGDYAASFLRADRVSAAHDLPERVRGTGLYRRGSALINMNRPADAVADLDRAVGIFRGLGDRHGVTANLLMLGQALAQSEAYGRALDVYREIRSTGLPGLGFVIDLPQALVQIEAVDRLIDRHDHAGAVAMLDEAERLAAGRLPPIQAWGLYSKRAFSRLSLGDRRGAFADHDTALRLLGDSDPVAVLMCRADRAGVLVDLGHYEAGLQEYDEVLREIGQEAPLTFLLRARINRATALHRLGRTPLALAAMTAVIDDAVEGGHTELAARGLIERSAFWGETGRFGECLRDAEAVERLVLGSPPESIAGVYWQVLGCAKAQVGHLSAAAADLERAVAAFRVTGPLSVLGPCLLNLGLTYQRLGEPDEGARCAAEAGEIVLRYGTPAEVGPVLGNIGVLRSETRDHAAAATTLAAALDWLGTGGRPYVRGLAHMNLGLVEDRRDNGAAAERHYRAALALFERYGGGAQTSLCRLNLGNLLDLRGDHAGSVTVYRGVDTSALSADELYRYHIGYGNALCGCGDTKAGLSEIRRSIAVYREARLAAGAGEATLEYFRRADSFALATQYALRHGDDDYALAFDVAQEGKAALAGDLLRLGSPAPPPVTDRVRGARTELVEHLRAAHAADRTDTPEGPERRKLLRDYATACRAAEADGPDNSRPSNGATRVPLEGETGRTIDAVRKAVGPNWVLLDFWHVGLDELRVFVLAQDRAPVVETINPLRGGKEFSDRLDLLGEQLRNPGQQPAGWTDDVWSDLYKYLFAPLKSHLTGRDGIYLVPHRIWHGVPLHAARFREGTQQRYLAEKYQVAYLPSAAVLPHLPRPTRPTKFRSLANPERGTPKTLPFAEWDALRLREAVPAADVFAGPDAVVGRTDLWSDVDYLHFGCHGSGEERHAGLSRLYLHDDCLLAHDVLYRRPPLRSGATVVLSGCQTGTKDWRAVDESMGLMTAFLLRGASSVLASQWNLDDYFAARTVDGFTTAVLGGAAPGEAYKSGTRHARNATPRGLIEACDLLLQRFPKSEYRHEAEVISKVRDSALKHAPPMAGTSRGGPTILRTPHDPLLWAAFQLFGRVT